MVFGTLLFVNLIQAYFRQIYLYLEVKMLQKKKHKKQLVIKIFLLLFNYYLIKFLFVLNFETVLKFL